MDPLPSWEQMKDGGWAAWKRSDGNKGKEIWGWDEETSEWTVEDDGADGEIMS